MPMPSASATVSWARIARQARPAAQEVGADQRRGRGGGEQHEIPAAGILEREAADARRVDHDAGGEAAPALVLAAEIGDDEIERERRHCEIESTQAQRRQAEDNAENSADQRRRRQREPERRPHFANQNADGERAGGEETGVAERNLPGIAGQQHQRQRADGGEERLTGEIEIKGPGEERK